MSNLADRIRRAAQEVGGLNQLAERTGIPRRTIGSWLQGRKPKPEALRKISEETRVSLAWLIVGAGSMRETGGVVEEAAQKEADESSAAFDRAMPKVGLGEPEPMFSKIFRSQQPMFNIELLERLARIVTSVHKSEGVRLPPEKVSAEAGLLYNLLLARVVDPSDAEEIEAVLPQLEHLLRKRLSDAKAEPGTGKRSAS
ncbi:helix-turn-helix domain-containing protein [Nitratireductor rhodophyticola]